MIEPTDRFRSEQDCPIEAVKQEVGRFTSRNDG
jgi:hypothetical protein